MAYQYENVKLEKGMYGQSGRSFLKVLESLDPSENYKGTALEGLDAFQRQLKRFDIHVKGAGSDMVEKFFHTSESSVLFPEFVSRVVRQGLEEAASCPTSPPPSPALTAWTTALSRPFRRMTTRNSSAWRRARASRRPASARRKIS